MSNNLHLAQGLRLLGQKTPPIATCPRCGTGEPLVFTFDRPYFEFHCMTCKGWYGFLDPEPAPPTEELSALCEQRQAEYAASKEAH